jgi:hypothetical protein
MRQIWKNKNSSNFSYSYLVFLIPSERGKNMFDELETILF